jgi:hypothetical protein
MIVKTQTRDRSPRFYDNPDEVVVVSPLSKENKGASIL